MSDFKWTDELVIKYLNYTLRESPVFTGRYGDMHEFKRKNIQPAAETLGKDWEVTEYRHGGERWQRLPTGFYCTVDSAYPVKTEEELQYLRYPDYHIHSLRRLSDGEVFTAGKAAILKDKEIFISKFHVFENIMRVEYVFPNGDNYASGITTLSELQKQKQPLFTTTDEKQIFRDDEFWYLENWKVIKAVANPLHAGAIGYAFSTREAAEEYVVMNKPCLSYKEVEKYIDEYPPTFALAKLYSLAQSRIK